MQTCVLHACLLRTMTALEHCHAEDSWYRHTFDQAGVGLAARFTDERRSRREARRERETLAAGATR
jgi:hypothetical protein